jgi:hypothetical protein
METEKIQINLGEGVNNAEVILRQGEAVRQIEPKPPVKTRLEGVISVPAEYLRKRVDTEQFTQERSHLIVDREKVSLTLIINEDDEYLRGEVTGTLEFHPKFVEFGINGNKKWTPVELGRFFKMNRSFFADEKTNRELVTDLMNFSATVNNKIEKSSSNNGDQKDYFEQAVQSNLPKSFYLKIPIFKGKAAQTLEIETVSRINGREVTFSLISSGATQVFEEERDKIIDEQLSLVREIAPRIAIIEV